MSERPDHLTDDAIAQFLRIRSADPELGLLDDIVRTVGATPQDRPWLGLRPILLPRRTLLIVAMALLLASMGAIAIGSRLLQPDLPRGPFEGSWVSISDTDRGTQTMTVSVSADGAVEITVHDDVASVCSGTPSTMTGTGRIEGTTELVIPAPVYACDDGSEPESLSGPPLEEQLRDLTYVHDPTTDALTDNLGSVWARHGAEDVVATISPTAAPFVSLAAHKAVMDRLMEALNRAAAGDAGDETSLRDVFTEGATISPFAGWEPSPVSTPGLLGQWILHLQNWGFVGAVRDCWKDEGGVICSVHARWPTLLAEAGDSWHVDVVGDQIQTLTVSGNGQRYYDPTLPLSVAELHGWEQWLQETDPETAAALIPRVGSSDPVVSRYDPALAAEINASIRQYVEQRPPGDEILVTADLVEFGDRLVGLIGNMDRADGRTYVIAGRYETETDLYFPPDEAVLAAFDDVGTELWRIDLDGTPRKVVAVAGDVWVWHRTGALSRIDASDGRFIDRVTVGDAWSMFAAFGSVWVRTLNVVEGSASGQLIRVDPDMSTTTIELPASIIASLDDVPSLNAAAGAGGIWVALGGAGVAVVDVESGLVTVIPADDIGHEVREVAVDADVAYVASGIRVTSIVDGNVVATASPGRIEYLGRMDGVFGVQLGPEIRQFAVLRANDPMVVEHRQISTGFGIASEIDGEAWTETGRNHNLRRIQLLPVSEGDGE
jgi:hypothetical protein